MVCHPVRPILPMLNLSALFILSTQSKSRLMRYRTRLVLAAWLAFVVLALSLAFAGMQYRFSELQIICETPRCVVGQPAELIVAMQNQGVRIDAAAMRDKAFSILTFDSILCIFIFALGAVLIWQKPGNLAAVLSAFVFVALAVMLWGTPDSLGRAEPAFVLPVRLLRFLSMAGLLVVFNTLPAGRFRWGWLRWLTALFVLACFFFVVVQGATLDMPIAADNAALGALAAIAALTALASLWWRLRASETEIERRQLQWILAGASLAIAWLGLKHLLYILAPLVMRGTWSNFADLINIIVVMSFAGCLAVAILQFQLFDIEIVINRGLVYGALTLFIIGAYALIVGGLSVAFARLAPGDDAVVQLLVPLIATSLIVLVFQPLRDKLQRFVNRLMYGDRDEPYAALARLGQRLEAAFEPAAILPSIVETVARTLNLPYVAIATVEHGALNVKSEWRTPDAQSSGLDAPMLTIPLVYQNEPLGELRASPRRGETTLAEVDRRLLSDLAQQASAAVHGVRLMDDLRTLSIDLQASRERLVLAREEERRRLRRDLHDDLAPTLAGLALTASIIADRIPANPGKAVALANDLNHAIRATIGDIRRLVDDLRPPSLDQLGLVAALRERAAQFSLAGNGLCVTVEADELPPLPAAIEVAAYRIAQEALMNAIRHAQAHTCRIRLTRADARLLLEISDDGVGLSEARTAGLGLHSMQERAVELGGQCLVESAPNGGTCVHASLPITRHDAP
jgi:signal transduction histidine kinase